MVEGLSRRQRKLAYQPKQWLVITIDVECDYNGGPTWHYSNPLTFRSVTEAIPGKLQPLLNRYGAKPTYLVANNVLENDESARVLRSLDGEYELGTHLHGEFIEPQKKVFDYSGAKAWDNQCQYPPEIEYEKMKRLTDLFRQRFGYAPLSFRAGRFSAGNNTITVLERLGYKVDASVTPHVAWVDQGRSLDFRDAPEQPYFPDRSCLLKQGNSPVLEVPLSIKASPLRRLGGLKTARMVYAKGRLGWLFGAQWLRPTVSDTNSLTRIIDHFARKYGRRPLVVHNLMFHNVEVCVGTSPYTGREEDCQRYLARIEAVLQHCQAHSIGFAKLSDIYATVQEGLVWGLCSRKIKGNSK